LINLGPQCAKKGPGTPPGYPSPETTTVQHTASGLRPPAYLPALMVAGEVEAVLGGGVGKKKNEKRGKLERCASEK
jgi:hypothetical protein